MAWIRDGHYEKLHKIFPTLLLMDINSILAKIAESLEAMQQIDARAAKDWQKCYFRRKSDVFKILSTESQLSSRLNSNYDHFSDHTPILA